jgi:tRNA-binding protein
LEERSWVTDAGTSRSERKIPSIVKPPVKIAALEALDIRVGTIPTVEDVPKSAKLVRLTVDFGDHRRRILAGMKQERADHKEIEGKQCLFLVNLEPRTIMGEVSEGMLLDIGHADGLTPCLAVPERPVPNGARAG